MRVTGNYIGTDPTGREARPNGLFGIQLFGLGNDSFIGGILPGEGNLISGNGNNGIEIGSNVNTVLIQGNFIGTDATGGVALPNAGAGINFVRSSDISIGTAGFGNVISGNAEDGVRLDGESHGIRFESNFIGTDATGLAAVPNLGSGILSFGAIDITIGGNETKRNIISGNAESGVAFFFRTSTAEISDNYIGVSRDGVSGIGNANGIVLNSL